jgi:IclR family acetate operon transcriptional repressor
MAMQQTPSVSERALQLLEIIAKAEQPPTLNELVSLVELPKATTHRFVSLLETLGFALRTPDGRHYQVGHRLTALAIDVMRNSLSQAPRRAILTSLVEEIKETCNITVLDGSELIYLDRVESDWPIQIRLSVGSRVPLHCTASGKLFLSLAPPQLRKALIESHPLRRHTPHKINEEFIEGMAAAAVPVWDSRGKICATVAVHGPTGRLPVSRAIALTPALKKAAERLSQTFVASVRE